MYSEDYRSRAKNTYYFEQSIIRLSLTILFVWALVIYDGSWSKILLLAFASIWLYAIMLFQLVRKAYLGRNYIEVYYWLKKKVIDYSIICDVSLSEKEVYGGVKKTHVFYNINIKVLNEPKCVVIRSKDRKKIESVYLLLKKRLSHVEKNHN